MTSTTTLDFSPMVSLAEAIDLIVACPDNIFFLQAPPGCGKSYTHTQMRKHPALQGHLFPSIVDVPNLDIGDTAMPVVDKEKMLTNYAPNARFQLTQGKPVVLCLDEFTKGFDPVKNMLHPMFETTNRRLGDVLLHPGSIVYLTGNLSTDNVGDDLKAHSRNRITVLKVRPPTALEWIADFAKPNGLNASVIRWVEETPQCLDFYVTHASTIDGNPYPFNPKVPQQAFVSGRSLERASSVVDAYIAGVQGASRPITSNAMMCALAGTVGESAARDMEATIAFQQELPPMAAIVADPENTRIPDSPGACAVLIYSIIPRLDARNVSPVMRYILRLHREWQAVFIVNAAGSPQQGIIYKCEEVKAWLLKNQGVL